MSEQPLNLPSNSISGRQEQEKPKVEKVVTGKVVTRKKSLLSKWTGSLIAENKEGLFQVIIADVIIIGLKQILTDGVSTFLDSVNLAVRRAVQGDAAAGIKPGRPIPYHAYSRTTTRAQPWGERTMSPHARATHDFREVILASRIDCERILEGLREIILRWDAASVADLYDLLGIPWNYTDRRYGWDDLSTASYHGVRGGYMLDLPRTILLD